MYGRLMSNRHLGEEVVQEAYTNALQHWAFITPDLDMDKFIGTILRNCANSARNTEKLHGIVDRYETVETIASSAIPNILLGEIKDRIRKKPDNIVYILNLYLFEQYTNKEIAELVPETANNIRQIVHRFRTEIKNDYHWSI